MKGNFELNGYIFNNRSDYEKAKKEAEAISYISMNSDLKNSVLAKKIYEKLLDKGTFQTVIGYTFLSDLRKNIMESEKLEEGMLRCIPVKYPEPPKTEIKKETPSEEAKRGEQYRELYEKEKKKKGTLKIVLVFLVIMIVGMFAVAQFTPYTIFTNYETKIINQYEDWQNRLEEKEAELNEREQKGTT
ncbi:MAG: hypothetical protein RSB37_02370, partial [Acetivibrio sp.]